MRADRLVAALLVLQARGRVTAAELAEELEVSERTARRDLEALGMAGVPVYSQSGRGGGWSLVGGARTDLSGLTAAEARTLFLVAGPSSQATPAVKAALRKLVRALPETMRAEAQAAASAVVLDPSSWDRTSMATPEHLDALQRAIVRGVQVRMRYAGRGRPESARTVHPLGLIVKGSLWYLVAGTEDGQRTFRVDRVRSVEPTDAPVDRPEEFDLAETWKSVVAKVDEQRAPYKATVRVDSEAVGGLRRAWGTRVRFGRTLRDGRMEAELRGYSANQVAIELAGFGSSVEVISPDEVRTHLARLARELGEQYA
jgi:predicted DNA-binding transcriptional regulator YafY